MPPRRLNYADREYFKVQKEHPDVGLYIGAPVASRSDGQINIGLSRRINKPDGSFGGIVLGAVHVEYFHRLFARMRLGPQGSLTLFRTDGTIIMREPFNPAVVGTIQKPARLFSSLLHASEGEYVTRSVVDNVDRLYHYRKIGQFPLVQTVAFSLEDIYANWWRKAIMISCAMGVCSIVILGLWVALRRELQHRGVTERRLTLMAQEDSLTGIANRRRFDSALAEEWRRAARYRTPLSLLMIDVDFFKSFNDMHGHTAGDAVLAAVGACLRNTVLRPGETAARYGGEEFVILLPHSDGVGAFKFAEKIRLAVLHLGIAHPGSQAGSLSVSIGVSSCLPDVKHEATTLVVAADAALYASKARGRNTTTLQAEVESDETRSGV